MVKKTASKKPTQTWDLFTLKAWFDGTAKGIIVGLCMLVGFLGKYVLDEFIEKKQQLEQVLLRMEVLETKVDLIIKQTEDDKNNKQSRDRNVIGSMAKVLWSPGGESANRPILLSSGIYFCERPKRLRTARGERITNEADG